MLPISLLSWSAMWGMRCQGFSAQHIKCIDTNLKRLKYLRGKIHQLRCVCYTTHLIQIVHTGYAIKLLLSHWCASTIWNRTEVYSDAKLRVNLQWFESWHCLWCLWQFRLEKACVEAMEGAVLVRACYTGSLVSMNAYQTLKHYTEVLRYFEEKGKLSQLQLFYLM